MSLFLSRLWSAVIGLGAMLGALLAAKGGLKDRLKAVLGPSAGQRSVFALLRLGKPRLALPRNLIACYPGSGSLILSRATDVEEVLARQADFAVVYEPRMRKITAGPNFFLGMQDGPDYQRDATSMHRLIEQGDMDKIVLPLFRTEPAAVLADAGGCIDLPVAMTARIPALMVQRYFGLYTATVPDLIPWATAMFHYLFSDLTAEPIAESEALTAAAATRDALDAAIAAPTADTLIARAVAAREAGEAAFAGDGVRNNMIGIIIGAIPTLSKAACYALDELFRRPAALANAQATAQAGDEAGVGAHLFEALRFNPANPVIYRRATDDTRLGSVTVTKNTMLLAANLSMMHDEAVVPSPRVFRTDRPWGQYLLWGRGLHLCFGDHINRAALPAMMMPLLRLPGLRRSPGSAGQIDGRINGRDTPFPRHFSVEWDA